MTTPATHMEQVRDKGRRAADSRWMEIGARVGLGARGVLYVLLGVLALQVAFGDRAERADNVGALEAVSQQPFGEVLLTVLAIGLGLYALWHLTEALFGGGDEADRKKRLAEKGISLFRALVYGALCSSAFFVLRSGDQAGASQGEREEAWTAKVLGWTGGRWLVGLVGLAIIAGGAYLVVRGLTRKFEEDLDLQRLSNGGERVVRAFGVAGYVARGVVVGLLGVLLAKAALDYDPEQAAGVDGTLRTIADQGHGQVLLVLTALGLAAFGLFSLVEARLRRV